MKIKIILVLAMASVMSLSAKAQNVSTVSMNLDRATVFFTGAELFHSSRVRLSSGTNELKIEGLSTAIDINSLKIKVSGGAMVSSYEFSVDHLSQALQVPASVRRLEDSVRIYTAQLEAVRRDAAINKKMQQYLEQGITKNVSGSEHGLGIDELVKTMDYYKDKSLEMLAEYSALQVKSKEISDRLNRLQLQLQEENSGRNKMSGILRIDVMSPSAQNALIEVSYITAQAAWYPQYDVNIASTDAPVRITAKANVIQATGFDWENVRLTLSSAAPTSGKQAPLFSTWLLRELAPAVSERSPKAAMMQNTYSYAEIYEESAVDEIVVMGFSSGDYDDYNAVPEYVMSDYIAQQDNIVNVTYDIDIPYNIPGNGRVQTIDLLNRETEATYKYYTAPKLDEAVYVIAEIEGWERMGLLSGNANITFDGTYVGETFIDASSTRDNLTLTLGRDSRVAVKRELVKENSASRSVGSDTQRTFTYKITVRNNSARDIDIVVKDQYPVSATRNIQVELGKDTTAATANVPELGVVTWEGPLASGETKTYLLNYSVRYPKNMRLNL